MVDSPRQAKESVLKGGDNMRSYVIHSQAWYAKTVLLERDPVEEIAFYDTTLRGEASMTWHRLAGTITPQLCVYDDGGAVLWSMRGVLADMATLDNQRITPERFVELLKVHGFRDATNREG